MELSHNKEKYYWVFFIFLSGLLISLEILISASFYQSVIILVAINLFLFLIAYFLIQIRHFPTFLLILNIIPLIYLNDEFHYYLKWILVQDTLIFALVYLAILKFSNLKKNTTESSIRKPLLIMVGYFFFCAIYGLIRGHDKFKVIDELYHFCYYLLPLVIIYLLQKRENYIFLFKAILFVITFISLEYILIYLSSHSRVITFQSTLFLISVSISLSFILYQYKYKIIWISIFILGSISLVISQTRSLWVSVFISLVLIIFFYLKQTRKKLLNKIAFYSIILIVPAFLFSAKSIIKADSMQSGKGLESRAYSISNPTEDVSFLMRVELGYYTLEKFLQHPLFGNGLGDYVKYKILINTGAKVYYPDNTWLYVLWKGGIIGFVLFTWVFWIFLKDTWFVHKNATKPEIVILSLAIWAISIGFMLSSFFAATLIKYKYGVVIAIMIAFVEYEKGKIKESYREAINI